MELVRRRLTAPLDGRPTTGQLYDDALSNQVSRNFSIALLTPPSLYVTILPVSISHLFIRKGEKISDDSRHTRTHWGRTKGREGVKGAVIWLHRAKQVPEIDA